MENEFENNFIENDLIFFPKQTVDVFLKRKNSSELIALYFFYYYTAKCQKTNQPKCTTDYVANALHWNKSAPSAPGVVQEMHQGGANDAPNNIEDNIEINNKEKEIYKEKETPSFSLCVFDSDLNFLYIKGEPLYI